MSALALLLTAIVALAGCSNNPAPAASQPDSGFDDFRAEATATTGIIRGVVVDDAIRPLANATITATPGGKTTTSNDNGLFLFGAMQPGSYFLQTAKAGYNATQTAAEVVAGVDEPNIVKILLVRNPGAVPNVEEIQLAGFITCGVAVVVSSVGCATVNLMADAIGDRVYFPFEFTSLPTWIQGELVWTHTQPAGGQMIWQIAGCATPGDTNPYCDGPPAMPSPALTFVDTERINEHADSIMDDGIQYNIFGGPHATCTADTPYTPYGCGVTINQKFDIFLHHFYNFVPPEGWRFTNDGSPQLPR